MHRTALIGVAALAVALSAHTVKANSPTATTDPNGTPTGATANKVNGFAIDDGGHVQAQAMGDNGIESSAGIDFFAAG